MGFRLTAGRLIALAAVQVAACASLAAQGFMRDDDAQLRVTVAVEEACLNETDGRITLSVTGGTAPYAYDWFGEPSTGPVLDDIPNGRYPVTVSDAEGRQWSAYIPVDQKRSPGIITAARDPKSSCDDGSSERKIRFTSGVTLSYILTDLVREDGGSPYEWHFDHRPDGHYNVKVFDVDGCYQNFDFLVYSFDGFKNAIQVGILGGICEAGGGRMRFSPIRDNCGAYTYTWPDGNRTQYVPSRTINITSRREYPVTVTRPDGESTTVTMPLPSLPPVTLSHDARPASAPGIADGGVEIAVESGQPTFYVFRDDVIIDFGDGSTFVDDGVPSGVHHYRVDNGSGCGDDTFTADLTAPPCDLDVSRSYIAADVCTDNSAGAIVAEATGGTAPYDYELRQDGREVTTYADYPEASLEISNLFPGDYEVIIRDADGCRGTKAIALGANPPAPTCTPTEANPDGVGGALDVALAGGQRPYAVTVTGPDYAESFTVDGDALAIADLDAGPYAVEVVDAIGCTGSCTATVTARVDPCWNFALDADVSGLRCFADGADGRIALRLTAGTAPYRYFWSHDGAIDGPVADGLDGGQPYTATVTDANGCRLTQTYTLTRPAELTYDLSRRHASGAGQADGELHLLLAGGHAPYSVTVHPVDDFEGDEERNFSVDARLDLTDLLPDTYSVSANDARGCPLPVIPDVFIDAGRCNDFAVAIADSLNPGCRADGELLAVASGGTRPYAFAWADGATGAARDDLAAGRHVVTVTDAEGCRQTAAHTFRSTPPVFACASAPGDSAVHVAATQGLRPFTYVVSGTGVDGADYRYAGTSDALDFSVRLPVSGTYRVELTGAKACVDTCAVVVEPCERELAELPVAVAADDLICAADGGTLAFASTSPGDLDLAEYETSVDGGATWAGLATYRSLTPGTYRPAVRRRDYRQCVYYGQPVVIRRNPAQLTELAATTAPSGCGAADGEVRLAAPAWASDLAFRIRGAYALAGVEQDSGTFGGLVAGAYQLTVEHLPSGCTRTFSASVDDGQQPIISAVASTDSEDCMAFDGTVRIGGDRFGEATRFGVSRTADALLPADDPSWSSEPLITGLDPGRYFARVRDAATGCSYFWPDTIVIGGERPPYLAGVEATAASTCLQPDGRVAIVPDARAADSLGHAELRYTFDGGATWAPEGVRADLTAGTYRVGVATAAQPGCITWDSAVVADGFRVRLDTVTRVRPWGCTLDNGVIAFVDSSGADQRFSIDGGASFRAEATFEGLRADTFDLVVAPFDLGCPVAIDTLVLRDNPLPPLALEVLTTDALGCFADDGAIALSNLEGAVRYEVYEAGATRPVRNWPNLFREYWGREVDSLSYPGLERGAYVATAIDRTFPCRTDTVAIELFGYDTLRVATDLATPPTCYLDRDGLAFVSATGGDGAYAFTWADGTTGPERPNLAAGDYAVRLTDGRGCADSASFAYPHPPAYAAIDSIVGDLDQCGSREVWYDLGYLADTLAITWERPDGSVVEGPDFVSDVAGRHSVTVRSPDGCGYVEPFDVELADTTQPALELLAASTYERGRGGLEIFEVSAEIPEDVAWVIDDPRITVVDSSDRVLRLRFAEPGTYTVGIRGRFGECSAQARRSFTVTDEILLEDDIVAGVRIEEVDLYPNPHRGIFEVDVELSEVRNATVELVDLRTRRTLEAHFLTGRSSYRGVRFGRESEALYRGRYLLVVRAGSSVRVVKHVRM